MSVYPLKSVGSVVISTVSFLIVVICVFLFSFASLPRGLSLLLIFSKNKLFVALILSTFLFQFHCFLLFIISFFPLALTLFCFAFLHTWCASLDYWFEIFLLSNILWLSAINFPWSTVLASFMCCIFIFIWFHVVFFISLEWSIETFLYSSTLSDL